MLSDWITYKPFFTVTGGSVDWLKCCCFHHLCVYMHSASPVTVTAHVRRHINQLYISITICNQSHHIMGSTGYFDFQRNWLTCFVTCFGLVHKIWENSKTVHHWVSRAQGDLSHQQPQKPKLFTVISDQSTNLFSSSYIRCRPPCLKQIPLNFIIHFLIKRTLTFIEMEQRCCFTQQESSL